MVSSPDTPPGTRLAAYNFRTADNKNIRKALEGVLPACINNKHQWRPKEFLESVLLNQSIVYLAATCLGSSNVLHLLNEPNLEFRISYRTWMKDSQMYIPSQYFFFFKSGRVVGLHGHDCLRIGVSISILWRTLGVSCSQEMSQTSIDLSTIE